MRQPHEGRRRFRLHAVRREPHDKGRRDGVRLPHIPARARRRDAHGGGLARAALPARDSQVERAADADRELAERPHHRNAAHRLLLEHRGALAAADHQALPERLPEHKNRDNRGRHRRARSGARGGRGGPRAHDLPAGARLRALRALLRPVPRDTAAGAPARHARRIPARGLQRRGLRHRHAQLRLRDEPHTRRTLADAEHKIHLARREDDFLDGRKRPRRQHTARARACAAGPAAPSRSR